MPSCNLALAFHPLGFHVETPNAHHFNISTRHHGLTVVLGCQLSVSETVVIAFPPTTWGRVKTPNTRASFGPRDLLFRKCCRFREQRPLEQTRRKPLACRVLKSCLPQLCKTDSKANGRCKMDNACKPDKLWRPDPGNGEHLEFQSTFSK